MKRIWGVGLFFLILMSSFLAAHEIERPSKEDAVMTQGVFARQIAKAWEMHRLLPIAPVKRDYVLALHRYNISPLRGWDPQQKLARGDYEGVLSRAGLRVNEYYQERQDFCNRICEVIEDIWGYQKKLDGSYKRSSELLKDVRFFPEATPACPFGRAYRFDEEQHRVKRHSHVQPKWVRASLWANEDWMHSKDGILAP